jgi:transcription antitermination factor NusG
MPRLPMEPSLFPADLFCRPVESTECPSEWWVLYTRAHAEKALARHFFGRQIAFFLPLYQKDVRVAGRWHRSYLPIFPSYIFLYGSAEHRLAALETNLVSRSISVHDQDRLWLDLSNVFRLITSGVPLSPEPRLEPGRLVEVTSGIMAGLQGKVLKRARQLRLVIEVQFLHQAVSVEIDNHMLRLLENQDVHSSAPVAVR